MQYLLLFLEGIITFISPCLLPMLPIYVSYFAAGGTDKRRALSNSIGFVSGFTIVFVVLNFWASWCPPCKSEMPEFNEVYKDVEKEGVAFLMVDLVDGHYETKETGMQYIAEQGFSFPVYFDTEQKAADAYGILSIPSTILIDKEGYIATTEQGPMDAETLRKKIDAIK
ncbi:MAG TPA: hypothetical protein DC013_02380 [Ruminococcaceae bacterium]|jgi:thiol-disulfide isomerase/thioredoxin|nr:hypothetical protein [Oscillospiraceae bacterium]